MRSWRLIRWGPMNYLFSGKKAVLCVALHCTGQQDPCHIPAVWFPPSTPNLTSLSYPSILSTCVQLHFSFTELRSSQSHLYRQLLTYIFSGLVSPILNIQISTENNLSGTHVSSPRFTIGSHFIFLPQATQANGRKKKFWGEWISFPCLLFNFY